MRWMLYGANGYTGRLIAAQAADQGQTPVLAGRNGEAVGDMGRRLGLETQVFGLDGNVTEALAGVDLVLHCAGPFSATAEPMMRACLASKTHYLDITGEIAVFELAQSLSAAAREAGVVLCPGVGFDVIPTDCLAAALKQRLPNATHLTLGFDSRSGLSRGTAKTSVEGLAKGGMVRRNGQLEKVPLAYKTRTIDFGDGEKLGMTIPWGDVSTAYHSTGIPNIEVYIGVPPALPKRLKRLNLIRPLLGLGFVQSMLKSQVEKRVRGPSSEQRRKYPMHVWGEATNGIETITGRLRTANGYEVTVHGSLGMVDKVLASPPEGGAYTPSLIAGPHFAEALPGSGHMTFD